MIVATVAAAAAWIGYTYAGYPLALMWLARRRRRASGPPRPAPSDRDDWPMITICMVARNAELTIAETLTRTLELDYPAHRRHIIVTSDASSDATDSIVQRFAGRGVQLLQMPKRIGKTACENVAAMLVRGDIVINTDASVVVERGAIKHLVCALDDPAVGVASCHDESVPPRDLDELTTRREKSYVGYEMMVRELESQAGGIVGASGCLYATRARIQRTWLPGGLARDFSSALIARRLGLSAVSVPEAICYVPRSTGIAGEYRRKQRTATRGLATLFHFWPLLNPFRYGAFTWKLVSHKLLRWSTPWLAIPLLLVLMGAAVTSFAAQMMLFAVVVFVACAMLGMDLDGDSELERACAAAAYLTASNIAILAAWVAAVRRDNPPFWEPTRRRAPSTFPSRPASPESSAP